MHFYWTLFHRTSENGNIFAILMTLWRHLEQMNRDKLFQLGDSMYLMNIENDQYGNELSSEIDLF